MNKLPLIYFLPAYIGSLKYYAKLIPKIKLNFNPCFLIVRQNDFKRQQMIDYCQQQGLVYQIIDGGFEKTRFRLPLLTPALKHFRRIRAARYFLKTQRPAKVVVTKVIAPHDVFVREALRQEIKVSVLQWSFVPVQRYFPERLHKFSLIVRIYFFLVGVIYFLIDKIYGRFDLSQTVPQPHQVGVINKEAAESFAKNYGFQSERIKIVGFADWQLVAELKNHLNVDESFRNQLLDKYKLNPQKYIITILAQSHHLKFGTGVTVADQIERYRQLISAVRKYFPPERAEVVLKLHPSDSKKIYSPLGSLNVVVCDDRAETEELICLSNLCLTDAWTTANFIILASNTPAIFLNFSKRKEVNQMASQSFYLHRIETNQTEFHQALTQAAAGTLPKNYDNTRLDLKSLDKILIFLST